MLALRLTRVAHPAVHLRRLTVAAASAGTGFLLLCSLGHALGHPDAPGASLLRLSWCAVPLVATVYLAVAVARADPGTRPRSGLSALGLGPGRMMAVSAATTALSCALGCLAAAVVFLYLRGALGLTGLPFDGAAAAFLSAREPLPVPGTLTLLSVIPLTASVTVALTLRPREPRTRDTARRDGRFGAYGRAGRPREIFGTYGRFGTRARNSDPAPSTPGTSARGRGRGAAPASGRGPAGTPAPGHGSGATPAAGHGSPAMPALRHGSEAASGPDLGSDIASGSGSAAEAAQRRGSAAEAAQRRGSAAEAAQRRGSGAEAVCGPGSGAEVASGPERVRDVAPGEGPGSDSASTSSSAPGHRPGGTSTPALTPDHRPEGTPTSALTPGHRAQVPSASAPAPGQRAEGAPAPGPGPAGTSAPGRRAGVSAAGVVGRAQVSAAVAAAGVCAPGSAGATVVVDGAEADGQHEEPDPLRPLPPRRPPSGLPWGVAVLAAGLAVEAYAGRSPARAVRASALPGGLAADSAPVLVGWLLTAFGLALAGPGLTHLCGRLLQSVRPGALRLLAGRVLMAEAARVGRPLGVVCAVASGAYAMVTLYEGGAPAFGPLTALGALVVSGCAVAALLTAAVEARQDRADTTAALVRLGAPATMLRASAALRAAALLALFLPLTLAIAHLAALPLAR
ncbi:hypothetical protein GCM10010510_57380 [Streptomyces anandii JCM 4720]|uniref:hypothetical protein n=1 Tax=Streptomyces anandii TaxID=285454 RepID=UPI0019BAA156|nr:hypothetical protein GCM10010510_57380 [Streptomyces anandii JCM 4720]